MEVVIKKLDTEEMKERWKKAFKAHNKKRPDNYYDQCLNENKTGKRLTLLAIMDQEITGISHLKYESKYPHFKNQNIPEINDLIVFPEYRRNGIANKLIEEFESIVYKKYKRIGIGVGLLEGYGQAQRIYCKRGYIPDGNGVMYNDRKVAPGEMVRADNDLVLYFIKELH